MSDEKEVQLGSWVQSGVSELSPDAIRSLTAQALERRRQAIVYTLARRFAELFGQHAGGVETAAGAELGGWTRIESLSQLRAVVGGRFQNLKQKWVAVGFPLREHRGDKSAKSDVNAEGWSELSVWISRQGYEARLGGPEDTWLFEVRKL